MALTVDTIESVLKVHNQQAIKAYADTASAFQKYLAAVNAGDAVEAKAAQSTARRASAKRKEVTETVKADDKQAKSAKAASDATIAAADKKAEAEHRANVRIRAMVAQSIAARNEEAVAAERAAGRISNAGSRATTAAQTRLMSGTGLGSGSAPAFASFAPGSKAETAALADQARLIQLIGRYKREGLNDTDAQARAEKTLANIVRARSRDEETAARKKLQQEMQGSRGGIGSVLRQGAAALGLGLGVRELSQLNDKYIEITNQLRIAGLEGSRLKSVQDALLATSVKYGVELGTLASLYSRATQAGSELGATQADTLKFTNAVAAAVKIQGGGVQQASGAILQLTQALQSGNVRAQEFNSLLNGLFPLLQTAAGASDKYGGSVAKLRQEVINGTLSSKEFFDLILKGTEILEQKAAKATLTTAAGFTALTNSLIVYFGEADKANGVSAALGAALGALARNLDTIIPIVAALAAAVGVQYVASIVAATLAQREMSIGAGILRGSLVALQSVALAGIIALFVSVAASAATSTSRLAAVREETERLKVEFSGAAGKASSAADGVASVGAGAAIATPKVRNFAGAVGDLADALYRQADAAKQARIQDIQTRLATARNAKQDAEASIDIVGQKAKARNEFSQGDFLGFGSTIFGAAKNDIANILSGGRTGRDNTKIRDGIDQNIKILEEGLRQEYRSGVTPGDIPGGGRSTNRNQAKIDKAKALIADLETAKASAGAKELKSINKRIQKEERRVQLLEQGLSPDAAGVGASGSVSGGSGQSGPTAAQLAKDAAADERAFLAARRRANSDIAAATAELANSAEERAAVEKQRLDDELTSRKEEIALQAKEGRLGKGKQATERAAELQGLLEQEVKLEKDIIDQRERERKRGEVRQAQQTSLDIEEQGVKDTEYLARTRKDQLEVALRLLDISERRERIELEGIAASETASKAEKDRAAILLASLESRSDARKAGVSDQYASPIGQYRKQLVDAADSIDDAFESIQVRGLESLNDGLTEAIMGAKSLGDVFKNVANQIISDLIRIAVQQAIIKPLAGGGDGGGILGFLGGIIGGGGNPVGAAASTFSSIFKGVSGRAVGGPVNAGTFYKTSEYGTEGYASFSQPGRVIPLGEMNTRPQGGTTIVQQSFTLDARGGITTPELLKYVNQTARTAAAQAGTAAYSSAVRAAPGAVAKAQRFGSNG